MIQFDVHFKDPPSDVAIAESPGPSSFIGTVVSSGQEHGAVVDTLVHIPIGYATLAS